MGARTGGKACRHLHCSAIAHHVAPAQGSIDTAGGSCAACSAFSASATSMCHSRTKLVHSGVGFWPQSNSAVFCLLQVKDKAIQRGKADSHRNITSHVPDVFRCCCGVPNQEGRCREPHGEQGLHTERDGTACMQWQQRQRHSASACHCLVSARIVQLWTDSGLPAAAGAPQLHQAR